MRTKNSNKIHLRISLSWRLLIGGILFFAAATILLMVLFFGNNKDTIAAVTGEIRSNASGNWNNTSTWQRYNGSTWVAYGTVPSYTDKIITIRAGHTVTITAALSADDVVIEAGGVLILNSGVTMTVRQNTTPDMKVYGIFRNAGTVTINSGTNITYYNGGTYQHNYTTSAGTIPAGVWNTGSTCEIVGYTTNTTMPSGLNQSFDNVKWNSTSQTSTINFAGGLTSLTGNLILESTGTGQLLMHNNSYTFNLNGNFQMNGGIITWNNGSGKTTTLNVDGDFIVTGGTMNFAAASNNVGNINVTGNYSQSNGTANFSQNGGTTITLNIDGDINYTAGNLNFTTGSNCTGNINLTGNYAQTNGIFNYALGSNSTTTLTVSGDYSHTGGTMTTTGSNAVGVIVFDNSSARNFIASGNTVSGSIDYTISSGSKLNMGTSQMIGRNFTLASGGEIGIGSFDGISASGSVGNIGVSGTRTFSAGGYYTYNGASNQNTGNGLPAVISKLTINNGNYLTLTSNVSVSSCLNLINGKILTGLNELKVTSTSGSAITGGSASSFVVGNLRRTVTGSGSFDFPLGSFVQYELMNVTLTGAGGITSLLGTFEYAVTNDTLYPLDVSINGTPMTEMLDYGYWTLQPTGAIGTGSYSVKLYETGFTNMVTNSCLFGVLVRNDANSSWQSVGTHIETAQSGLTSIAASRSDIKSFYQYGIALGDYPSFSSPALIGGVDGNVGAVYLYQDVIRGVDANMQITRIYNGASLSEVDNGTIGYNESFQPFVNYPANKDSYIEWDVKFKKANTTIDTTLQKITATGVDVDGDVNIREYVVATMPTSYSLDAATSLTMSNDSGRYKALGPAVGVNNIDTSHHELMYQLNYNNVSHIMYRTGAVNSSSNSIIRQTSLFFKSFLAGAPKIALPVELVEFKARLQNGKVMLNWITASEINNDFFTIERSDDNENFNKLFTKRGAGNSSMTLYYELADEFPLSGMSYYRLKQTDYDGKFTYSSIEVVDNRKSQKEDDFDVRYLMPNTFDSDFIIAFKMKSKGIVNLSLMNAEGKVVETKKVNALEGENECLFERNPSMNAGVYFIVFQYNDVRITRKIVRN